MHVETVPGAEGLGTVLAVVGVAVGEVDVLHVLAHVGPVLGGFTAQAAFVKKLALELKLFEVVVELARPCT